MRRWLRLVRRLKYINMENKIILGEAFDNSGNTGPESDALFPKETAVFDPTKEYIHLYTDSEDFKNKRTVNYHEPFIGAFVNDVNNIGAQYNKDNLFISESQYIVLKDGEVPTEYMENRVGHVWDDTTVKYYNIKRIKIFMYYSNTGILQ